MVDDSAADADASIAGKGGSFSQGIVLRCRDEAKIANLDQIIDFDRLMHSAMHVPCDLAHEFHMAGDQLLNIRFLFKILVSHHQGIAVALPSVMKKRIPP